MAWVINLKKRSDRLRKFRENNKFNFDVSVFNAYDINSGDNVPDTIVTIFWNSTLNSLFDRRYRPHETIKMSNGERGCCMSHYHLWKEIVNRNLEYGVIFEDDIKIMYKMSPTFIQDYLDVLPVDWDIFYLDFSHARTPVLINPSNRIFKGIYIWSTAAYIISLNGAKKCLANLPIDCPVDNFLSKLIVLGKINAYTPDKQIARQIFGDTNIIHT